MKEKPITRSYLYLRENRRQLLAGIGAGVLVAFGVWGLISITPGLSQLAGNAARLISSVFVAAEELHVETNATSTAAGSTFTLSWTHKNSAGGGTYTLHYPCERGVSLQAATGDNREHRACGTTHTIGDSAQERITLAATKDSTGTVPITISYRRETGPTAALRDSTTITVTNEATGGSDTPAVPAGPADLSIYLIDTGVVDPETNTFTARDTVHDDERAALRFAVKNRGGNTSKAWRFMAHLPTMDGMKAFESSTKQALAPGDRIEFTLGFDAIMTDEIPRVTVRLLPGEDERNAENNELVVPFVVTQR